MNTRSDILRYAPSQCKSLIIGCMSVIGVLATTTTYLYFSKEKTINKNTIECEKKLSKKDELIFAERARNEMIIDSILESQRKQIEYLTKRRRWN